MITETGNVVAIEPDALWVETIQQSACDACAAQKGCGQRLIARLAGHTSRIRVLLAGRPASEFTLGQQVRIGIPERVIVSGSLLVYLLPLVTLVSGVCIAQWLFATELAAVGLGLLGLLLGGAWVRRLSWLHRNEPDYQPVLLDTSFFN